MKYENIIKIHRNALDFLKSLDETRRKRVEQAIEGLKYFPLTRLDVIKLRGLKKAFRLRVGDIRVYFEYLEKERTIYIRKIGYREDFY